eukprot:8860025-Pyramimonas_sp.AAC.1
MSVVSITIYRFSPNCGVRIGEAKNPGPPLSREEAVASPTYISVSVSRSNSGSDLHGFRTTTFDYSLRRAKCDKTTCRFYAGRTSGTGSK